MSHRFRFTLHVVFWAFPAVGLWWILSPYLLQVIFFPVKLLLESSFQSAYLEMELNAQGIWLFYTQIMYLEQMQLQAGKLRVYSMVLGSMVSFSMGFALLWAFLLSVTESIRRKLWKLLLGSLVLSIFVVLVIYLDSLARIMGFMSRDDLGEIWLGGGITQAVLPPPQWLLTTISSILPLSTYIAIIIAPIIIAYWLNRDFIRAMLFSDLLDRTVGNNTYV
ncbi:exosortase H-associated membrane protein [Candidatus Venteria ishoeyi]|uniref:exosortase H-associated membrane protein n=1 Tax=Candidatus Venteria ishoeyi TaxID=1899563 RepID=UPI0025A67A25|nr:exosortase H-associated membrane protein [Candidatus Venteria ishoeyi]MDM8545311.1 exosortase H-associated membrane protein [Candidatus Venteria ishoeyi]